MDKVVNMRRYKAVSLGAVGCIAQISELGAHSKKITNMFVYNADENDV